MRKSINSLILLLCLTSGQQLQAAHRIVTLTTDNSTSANNGSEGEFTYELRNMQEGDTLLFSDDLKDKVIEFKETNLNKFPSARNITIMGNGVTLALTIARNIGYSNGLTLDNMIFAKAAGSAGTPALSLRYCYSYLHMKNCRVGNDITLTVNSDYDVNMVADVFDFKAEGCYFGRQVTIEGSAAKKNDPNSKDATIEAGFVSCTFRGFATATSTLPGSATLLNCVVDSVSTNAIFPRQETIVSKGYNVIHAKTDNRATWTETDTVNVAMDAPLALKGDVYKPVPGGTADGHLPANPTTIAGLEDVDFPTHDALGREIDYTVATHSGAIQSLYSDEPEAPPVPKYTLRLTTRGGITATIGQTEGFGMNRINFSDGLNMFSPITLYNSDPTVVQASVTKIGQTGGAPADGEPYNSFLNITPLKAGRAIVRISADGYYPTDAEGYEHPEAVDSVIVTVLAPDLTEYTDGVFFVNEDWFQHKNSTVNFLSPYGWHYNAYTAANGGAETFGATAQHGAIYGDRFYFVSKQEHDRNDDAIRGGGRLVVADARTLHKVAGFDDIGGGDGRTFLGVDDSTGYISTSANIVRFDIRNMAVGDVIEGTESGGGLYSGQVGAMLRVGDRVFAAKQNVGLLVINALTHRIETVLDDHYYFSLTLDNDGYIWSCASSDANAGGSLGDDSATNILVKIDPYTLETTVADLPAGFILPSSTWGAWQLTPMAAGKQDGRLYWVAGSSWESKRIIAFDPKTSQAETIFDLAGYDGDRWHGYGGAFGVHPVTNDLYFSIQRGAISTNVWTTLRIDPATKQIAEEYPMQNHWWYVAMPVFTDLEAPVVGSVAPAELSIDGERRIYLGDKVTDADSPEAAIVKSIVAGFDRELISAVVRNDSLIIAPLREVEADEITTLTLRFNSNGKVVTHDLAVTVSAGAATPPVVEENPFELIRHTSALYTGQTLQLALTAPQHFRVDWRSANTPVASVTQAGLVTALTPGTANIIVRDVSKGKADTCVVTVSALPSEPAYRLELNTVSLTVIEGERSTLTVTVTPPQAGRTVEWSSSDPRIAEVTSNGVVIGIAGGTCMVTARIGSVSASCAVSVSAKPSQVTVSSVGEGDATVAFPRVGMASYYLVHVYSIDRGALKPFLTLKVTPDGTITLRAAAPLQSLSVPLAYLSPGTPYVVYVEAVRETAGKAEVIQTEVVSFTTRGMPVGTNDPAAASARVSYSGGTLYVDGFEGADCTLTSITGQTVGRFRVGSPAERFDVSLAQGVYILTAAAPDGAVTIKFVARAR
ncbi:MAG: DUF5074 domain-containing protein [Tannerellaceae bacterium]|jgi:hypothetical protein|nr:DUF5074 domain-containing protein [Tannerellaceae bacterium]